MIMLKLKNNLFAKRTLLTVVAGVLLLAAVALTATHSQVSGAGLNPTAQQGGVLDIIQRQRLAIVGSWNIPDPGGIPTLVTFHRDGSLTENEVDHTFSGGNGTWAHLGGTQFAYTWVQ